MLSRIVLTATALVAAPPAFAAADPARYMPAELIAQTLEPKPGSTILIGFRMTPRPGWHGYWSNPGDSGIAPNVTWTAPPGVRFGPLLHPAPTILTADGISSYVHEGPHVLLARMTVGSPVAPGTPIPVNAKLSWAACTATQCVPLHATLTLHLVAGAGIESSDAAALMSAARRLPKTVPAGTFTVDGKALRLLLPPAARLDPARARFFPDDNDVFATDSARATMDGGTIAITGPIRSDLPRSIGGVVSDGHASYRIEFGRGTAAAKPEEPATAPAESTRAHPDSAPGGLTTAGPIDDGEPVIEATPSRANWWWIATAAVAILAASALLSRPFRRD